jgi:hypothetical protein
MNITNIMKVVTFARRCHALCIIPRILHSTQPAKR